MKVKVQWIINGLLEVEAPSNEAAEALVDEKLRSSNRGSGGDRNSRTLC